MQIYVCASAGRQGDGSPKAPFQTITQAAAIAQAGDEVLVAPGIYRECVSPRRGGESDACRVTYRSQVKGAAVITGAEPVKCWQPYEGNVWVARLSNGLFGEVNPYTTLVKGDWYFSTKPYHIGEVYLNDKAMYESETLEGVLNPQPFKCSWDPAFTIYRWFTRQEEGLTALYANFQGADPNAENVEINVRTSCFCPATTGVNYVTLSGFTVCKAATQWAPPTAYQEGMVSPRWSKGWIIEDCDISNSKCSGISLGKYLQPNNENKWTTKWLKDGTQTQRDAVCQAQLEGWTKENIGHHIIRRCHIHDCGQTGIVGHLGGVFSLIEDNHIHHINNKQDLGGAEIGGIKMHAAIDVTYRRNHIHHCTRGLWLDWQAQGTRVTQNLFHDNVPPVGTQIDHPLSIGEDIFVEVSHGPTLIDNNFLLSPCACRLSTQGIALAHNFIAGSFTWVGTGTDNGDFKAPSPRYTPYHVPHRTEVLGFMTILHGDARFYNNIFVQQPHRQDLVREAEKTGSDTLDMLNFTCGTLPYDGYPTAEEYFARFTAENVHARLDDKYYSHLPVYTGGNAYFNGAQPCDCESGAFMDTEHTITWALEEKEGQPFFTTNVYDFLPPLSTPVVSTKLLGLAFEPEQPFENPDGTPLALDTDYFGCRRSVTPRPGPLEGGCPSKPLFGC